MPMARRYRAKIDTTRPMRRRFLGAKRLTRKARNTTAAAMSTSVQREARWTRTALTPTSAGAEPIGPPKVPRSGSVVVERESGDRGQVDDDAVRAQEFGKV